MKNLFYFLCLLTLTFSCGDDDMAELVEADQLVGVWNLESLDYSGVTTTTDPYGETITSNYAGEAKDIDAMVEFKSNMEYQSSGSYTVTLVINTFGYQFEQDVVINDFLGKGTWQRNDNIITSMADNSTESSEIEIAELTENSLTFNFAQRTATNDQGFIVTQDFSGMYTFTK